jgi:osmotically inducible protein OsmC
VAHATHVDATLRTLAESLRRLRIERGFRLANLAAATGLSEVHLYRLEQGERAPSLSALLTLASVYGVDAAKLLDPGKPPQLITRHRGEAVWEGRESTGSGTMVTNGATLRYDAASRVSGPDGRSGRDGGIGSPEQLIGAALAGCFSMSLAERLGTAGFDPQRIATTAEVLLAVTPDGVEINEIRLDCQAGVDGIDNARLAEIGQVTKQRCVVSRALAAVPVTLNMQLAERPSRKPGPRGRKASHRGSNADHDPTKG